MVLFERNALHPAEPSLLKQEWPSRRVSASVRTFCHLPITPIVPVPFCVSVCVCVCVCTLSCAWLFTAPWTVACQAPQAPLSMGFSRQEYWSGLPFPPPGDLPDPGIEPVSLSSPTLTGGSFTTSATWEDHLYCSVIQEAQSGDGICGRNLRAEA